VGISPLFSLIITTEEIKMSEQGVTGTREDEAELYIEQKAYREKNHIPMER